MPGLVPGIHVLRCLGPKDVDGRDEPGHDVVVCLRLVQQSIRQRIGAHLEVHGHWRHADAAFLVPRDAVSA
jgi:hypothetical protein